MPILIRLAQPYNLRGAARRGGTVGSEADAREPVVLFTLNNILFH